MAIAKFSDPNSQSVYEAGLARLEENARQKRAMATNAAGVAGVRTSGVSQIPQEEIDRGAVLAESQLGSDVAQIDEMNRRADENFERQKELLGLQNDLATAAQDRWWKKQQDQESNNRWAQILGGGIGAAGNVLAAKYLRD
jgi:hypothetical protein